MIMHLESIFVVGFSVLGTYKIIELFVRRKERLAIIEKFTSLNFESEKPIRLPNLLFEKQDSASWPLRISLLLMGIGLGAICAIFLHSYYASISDSWNPTELIVLASIAFFGGIGLFIAFLIELKQKNKQLKPDND
ncbi:MAG: hypothetical protein LBR97_03770 [Dysgonamonadaceae bacterium]|jgi:hypothetical protein|nr:hypothetical protein [Dysgonamonadaceae bacterium]